MRTIVLVALIAVVVFVHVSAQDTSRWVESMKGWKYSSPRVLLPPTGKAATQNNPPCSAISHASASEVAQHVGAAPLGKWAAAMSTAFEKRAFRYRIESSCV
jgi:hypothetical protein